MIAIVSSSVSESAVRQRPAASTARSSLMTAAPVWLDETGKATQGFGLRGLAPPLATAIMVLPGLHAVLVALRGDPAVIYVPTLFRWGFHMSTATALLKSFVRDDEAATMPEYALMVALIAVVCIAAVTLIGTNANIKFNAIATAIGGA
jgi:pilus assembly protein Flp/PilA